MFNLSGKRKCIFCGGKNLNLEHIYPNWLFKLIEVDSVTFKPSTTLCIIQGSETFEKLEHTKWSSDQRDIPYKDFKTKHVCVTCNSGWMSDLENEIKAIFHDLLNGTINITEQPKNAYALSRWAIIKIILIARSAKVQQEFNPFLLNLLKEGIIPEGFIVEFSEMSHHFLNFHLGNSNPLCPSKLHMEEMVLAEENFFLGGLHIGKVGLRVSFLKTAVSVQRKQINKRLFLLYPFGGKLPYVEIDFPQEMTPTDRDVEISSLCNCLIISDTI